MMRWWSMMMRWRRWGVVVGGRALALVTVCPAHAAGVPSAYVVMDADTGTILAEKDAHKRWPPASMTKMMTVLLAMERVREGTMSLDEPVPASAWASHLGGSQVYL